MDAKRADVCARRCARERRRERRLCTMMRKRETKRETFVHDDAKEQVEDEEDELSDTVHGPSSTDKGIAKELGRRAHIVHVSRAVSRAGNSNQSRAAAATCCRAPEKEARKPGGQAESAWSPNGGRGGGRARRRQVAASAGRCPSRGRWRFPLHVRWLHVGIDVEEGLHAMRPAPVRTFQAPPPFGAN